MGLALVIVIVLVLVALGLAVRYALAQLFGSKTANPGSTKSPDSTAARMESGASTTAFDCPSAKRRARWGTAVVVCVYLASFMQPALQFSTTGGSDWHHSAKGPVGGVGAFFLGLIHVFELGVAWLANPVFLVGICLLWRRHYWSAALAGLGATLLALCALVQDSRDFAYLFRSGSDKVLAFLPGYWLWLTSMGCLSLAAVVLLVLQAFSPARSGISANSDVDGKNELRDS